METGVLVALLTAIASIIVATVSLVSNYLNGKRIAKANHEFKKLEFDIEKKRSLYEIFDDNLKKKYNALGEHIKHIQKIKDALLSITNSIDNSLDSNTALNAVSLATKELSNCHIENTQYLENGTKEAAHDAKGKSNMIFENLKSMFKNREYVNLSIQERADLESQINMYRDFEGVLRDEIVSILTQVK